MSNSLKKHQFWALNLALNLNVMKDELLSKTNVSIPIKSSNFQNSNGSDLRKHENTINFSFKKALFKIKCQRVEFPGLRFFLYLYLHTQSQRSRDRDRQTQVEPRRHRQR